MFQTINQLSLANSEKHWLCSISWHGFAYGLLETSRNWKI